MNQISRAESRLLLQLSFLTFLSLCQRMVTGSRLSSGHSPPIATNVSPAQIGTPTGQPVMRAGTLEASPSVSAQASASQPAGFGDIDGRAADRAASLGHVPSVTASPSGHAMATPSPVADVYAQARVSDISSALRQAASSTGTATEPITVERIAPSSQYVSATGDIPVNPAPPGDNAYSVNEAQESLLEFTNKYLLETGGEVSLDVKNLLAAIGAMMARNNQMIMDGIHRVAGDQITGISSNIATQIQTLVVPPAVLVGELGVLTLSIKQGLAQLTVNESAEAETVKARLREVSELLRTYLDNLQQHISANGPEAVAAAEREESISHSERLRCEVERSTSMQINDLNNTVQTMQHEVSHIRASIDSAPGTYSALTEIYNRVKDNLSKLLRTTKRSHAIIGPGTWPPVSPIATAPDPPFNENPHYVSTNANVYPPPPVAPTYESVYPPQPLPPSSGAAPSPQATAPGSPAGVPPMAEMPGVPDPPTNPWAERARDVGLLIWVYCVLRRPFTPKEEGTGAGAGGSGPNGGNGGNGGSGGDGNAGDDFDYGGIEALGIVGGWFTAIMTSATMIEAIRNVADAKLRRTNLEKIRRVFSPKKEDAKLVVLAKIIGSNAGIILEAFGALAAKIWEHGGPKGFGALVAYLMGKKAYERFIKAWTELCELVFTAPVLLSALALGALIVVRLYYYPPTPSTFKLFGFTTVVNKRFYILGMLVCIGVVVSVSVYYFLTLIRISKYRKLREEIEAIEVPGEVVDDTVPPGTLAVSGDKTKPSSDKTKASSEKTKPSKSNKDTPQQ